MYVNNKLKQEAQLPQRDRATHYVSKFILCFTSYGSYKCFKQQTLKIVQGHWPFDRPHTISY